MKYQWICVQCALDNGGHLIVDHISTLHEGKCDWCKKKTVVTEPRDYGFPKEPKG